MKNKRLVAAWRSAYILGHHLDLSVSYDGNVSFEVNESYFTDNAISVFAGAVILRWAFKAWADILRELESSVSFSSDYRCSVVTADGVLYRRLGALEKVGFTWGYNEDGELECSRTREVLA